MKGAPGKAAGEGRGFRRTLVTPEGVDLGLRIASAGERAGAFLIDAIIMVVTLVVFTIVLALAAAGGIRMGTGTEAVEIVWLVGFFALRNFYFLFFEMGPRAATPGKRLLGIRVASRNGGLLRADSIFARNAIREIEVFLPATFIFAQGDSVDGMIALAGFAWTSVFLFFPLFNRDRLRAGDIVAGTWVVQSPRRMLMPDMAAAAAADTSGLFAFTREQLDVYGIKELQTLEDVLRKATRETTAAVATRIRIKTGWKKTRDETDLAFLSAYYAALRKHLEAKMVFGVRRADKHSQ